MLHFYLKYIRATRAISYYNSIRLMENNEKVEFIF